jgi:hypothetical protein
MNRDELTALLSTVDGFSSLAAALYSEKYTGPLTLHFNLGIPEAVEPPPPRPVRIPLKRSRRTPSRSPAPHRDLTAPAPVPHSIG